MKQPDPAAVLLVLPERHTAALMTIDNGFMAWSASGSTMRYLRWRKLIRRCACGEQWVMTDLGLKVVEYARAIDTIKKELSC